MNSPPHHSWSHHFRTLSDSGQACLLAAFAFELTNLARDGYEAGTDQSSDPVLLRRLNEVQHRVTAAVVARRRNDKARYPDHVLLEIIVGGDDRLGARLRGSFAKAWQVAIGVPLGGDPS